jgi:hypothetical protein
MLLLSHFESLNFLSNVLGFILDQLSNGLVFTLDALNNLPFSVTSNLWLEDVDVILIFIAIFFIILFIKYEYKSGIYLSLFLLIIQALSHLNYRNKVICDQHLLVYDIYNSYHIDIISHTKYSSISHPDNDQDRLKYNCTAHRQLHQATTKINLEDMGIYQHKGLYAIKKKIICVDTDFELSQISPEMTIDLFILHKDNLDFLQSILGLVPIHKIVLPKFIKGKTELIERLGSLNILVHDIEHDGYLKYDLDE